MIIKTRQDQLQHLQRNFFAVSLQNLNNKTLSRKYNFSSKIGQIFTDTLRNRFSHRAQCDDDAFIVLSINDKKVTTIYIINFNNFN